MNALARPLDASPAIARRLRVGMPHLDIGGLSEGWLLRYAGDLHWEQIALRLRTASDQIRSDWGQRLYPTFVALRARYQAPLAQVRENDVLESSLEVEPCGRACAYGRVEVLGPGQRMSLEMLTTFAQREDGQLRMAPPAARHAARWAVKGNAREPGLARLAKAARRGEPAADDFAGPVLAHAGTVLGSMTYQPSPYADYNGAGLLYFAAYVTIADTAERLLVAQLGLGTMVAGDWALATSPVRRDVFYYANLPLGEALVAELHGFEPARGGASVRTHVRLCRAKDGARMADLVTERRMIGVPSRERP